MLHIDQIANQLAPVNFHVIDQLEQFHNFWKWIIEIKDWNTFEGWIARIFVCLLVVYLLLLVLKRGLENLAIIFEKWKSLGFAVKKSPEELVRLRRSWQFCRVISADLATLAKAESWNDQFFTDLEAEVEADGGYYASRVDRLLKRKSHGQRRVPSLIEAIESSTEQCLLVTGDPGSGKSVALRHLASQLADKASKSRSQIKRIPLYLNLKELPEPPSDGLSADFIKEFVLENIRRGDSDTAAYVRENWNEYRERGFWFFLFDSFDEIPAVLHAPTGSLVIRQHADAIRKFFEGMSACQGVLASREYKGPDTLPWKKFKILPLSSARQEDLIENSFLLAEKKLIVARHAIASGPGLLTNPLFLTLLCRYVKDEGRPPANDNELLLKHIQRLASREPEYIRKRYGLESDHLLEGSVRLAVLFAEQSSLSLAPTQDQILQSLSGEQLRGADLESLLAALIDVKIGRCDVKEARAGDRRFTFAHRRYQETLFVQHLVGNPTYLPANALLTDLRWRDYTVTLLQTGPPATISPLLIEANRLLLESARPNSGTAVLADFGAGIHYFEWRDSAPLHLLRLLQEGLFRRMETVPIALRESIKAYLDNPWEAGDLYDRLMVISLGGLLPEEDLQRKIMWAIEFGSVNHWDAAVKSSYFLSKMPEEMAVWFRDQLANNLLLSARREDVLKLEAIAAGTPEDIGAKWIVDRARVIRDAYQLSFRAIWRFPLLAKDRRLRDGLILSIAFFLQSYLLTTVSVIVFSFGVLLVSYRSFTLGILLCFLSVCFAARIARHLLLVGFRAVGEKLSLRAMKSAMWSKASRARAKFMKVLPPFAALTALLVAIGALSHFSASRLGLDADVAMYYIFGPLITMLLFSIAGVCLIWRSERASTARLRELRKVSGEDIALILRAPSWKVAGHWLESDLGEVVPSLSVARSFLRFIEVVFRKSVPSDCKTPLSRSSSLSAGQFQALTHILISRSIELEAASRGIEKPEGE